MCVCAYVCVSLCPHGRVYVLVASVDPLIVFLRPGHLRVSALRYRSYSSQLSSRSRSPSAPNSSAAASASTRSVRRDSGFTGETPAEGSGGGGSFGESEANAALPLARHVTNPSFGLEMERNVSKIIRPVTHLRDILQQGSLILVRMVTIIIIFAYVYYYPSCFARAAALLGPQ